ncbi:MAG: serine/threonine protein kinase [Kofleriaceae bacterium]|nr:serine/threonine protein kinase [Kofleriaceae bacterium]
MTTDSVTIVGNHRTRHEAEKSFETVGALPKRYGTQSEIGEGAMGQVFCVRDRTLNREIAMKVLKRSIASDELIKRFHVEAQIGGQLEHSGLLPVYDLGQDSEGNEFFTMRIVSRHQTLEDIISKLQSGDAESHKRFTMEERVQIIIRIADTLSYVHDRGVIHRDVKPANILISDAGDIYLVDFGVAMLCESNSDGAVTTTINEKSVEEGELAGTLLYMSPEQLLGEDFVGAKSDVYSLCAVAYELFSGTHYLGKEPPSSYLAILSAVLDDTRVDAEKHWDEYRKSRVPRQLSRILRWGLEKDRSSAIPTSDALNRALRAWLTGRAPVVCPGTLIQRCLRSWAGAIDRRPVLTPLVSIAGASIGIYCLLYTTLGLLLA